MNKTRKSETAGVTGIGVLLPQSIWRRVVTLFRHHNNPLLVASLTAFNEPRIYLFPDFTPLLRLILSRL
jgi:hypothetical protein